MNSGFLLKIGKTTVLLHSTVQKTGNSSVPKVGNLSAGWLFRRLKSIELNLELNHLPLGSQCEQFVITLNFNMLQRLLETLQ
jgi:hypothetical protein